VVVVVFQFSYLIKINLASHFLFIKLTHRIQWVTFFKLFIPIQCHWKRLSVFWTGNLLRGVPEVDECGIAEIGNSKEEIRGTI
jgi:hypothetical protein